MQLLEFSFRLPTSKGLCSFKDEETKYKYCMKSNLPKTKYITFNAEANPILDWNNFVDGQIPVPEDLTAYNVPCLGDSGSGQFVKKGPRYVLSAIYKGAVAVSGSSFRSKLMKHDYPCGTFTWRKGKYRHWNEQSESTTWGENLEWIKQKISLCNFAKNAPYTIL